jgi:DNA-binding transcriptional ArsR family regulator
MEQANTNEEAAFVISSKMAKALADGWRSRILMELSVRPLSPSQFVDFAGGELAHISRCFRQLAEWDFIEVVETRGGGRRRGGVEHVYRRVQRALFGTEVWETLPLAYRVECSGSTIESYIARISEAVEAETFDDEIDRHLSWDGVALDRMAWVELVGRLDEILYGLPDRCLEAVQRMSKTGEEPIPTTVGLAAFRSPRDVADLPPRTDEEPIVLPGATPFVISAKMAKALANQWRSRILMELRVRPLSPTLFVNDIGGHQRNITRYFAQLAEWGFIEAVETKTGGRRRGGKERFYRLKQRAYFDTQTWETLPRFLREECTASTLHSYFARVREAINEGTFDGESDRHFSWDDPALDRAAWNEIGSDLDEILDWLPSLAEEAAARMVVTGEPPIPTIVGLASFRSPRSSRISPQA